MRLALRRRKLPPLLVVPPLNPLPRPDRYGVRIDAVSIEVLAKRTNTVTPAQAGGQKGLDSGLRREPLQNGQFLMQFQILEIAMIEVMSRMQGRQCLFRAALERKGRICITGRDTGQQWIAADSGARGGHLARRLGST
jgi:hypothetical protein